GLSLAPLPGVEFGFETLLVVFARFQSRLRTYLDLFRPRSAFQFGNAPILLPELRPHFADYAVVTFRGWRCLFALECAFELGSLFLALGLVAAFLLGFVLNLVFKFEHFAVVCHVNPSSHRFTAQRLPTRGKLRQRESAFYFASLLLLHFGERRDLRDMSPNQQHQAMNSVPAAL